MNEENFQYYIRVLRDKNLNIVHGDGLHVLLKTNKLEIVQEIATKLMETYKLINSLDKIDKDKIFFIMNDNTNLRGNQMNLYPRRFNRDQRRNFSLRK